LIDKSIEAYYQPVWKTSTGMSLQWVGNSANVTNEFFLKKGQSSNDQGFNCNNDFSSYYVRVGEQSGQN